MSNPAHWRMTMALQFKPTIPPEGIRAVCIHVLLCEECQQFDAVMFQLNEEKEFKILHLSSIDRFCDTCLDVSYKEWSAAQLK